MKVNQLVYICVWIGVFFINGSWAIGDPASMLANKPVAAPHFREFFYVGGQYVSDNANGTIHQNQIYVEHLIPQQSKSAGRFPLVFIHGKGMTGTNFLQTADGSPGWASFFLNRGYELYIIDQAARGRSAWNPADSTLTTFSAELVSQRFTAVEKFNLWPQSINHTQWPGTGLMGDGIYDSFYSATVQFLSNDTEAQVKMRAAGAALLDRIGKAVVITHSQGGLYGWSIADARPHLVQAIVALEPTGPPFREAVFTNVSARAWGLTDISIAFSPAIVSASELKTVEHPAESANLSPCILQQEPARKFANIRNIPMAIFTTQTSYHSVYDHCSAQFLRQAGVRVMDFLRFEDHGLFGNAHMFFLEKNSWDAASLVEGWISTHV